MKYYINGKQVKKEEYKEQKQINKELLNQNPKTTQERDQWLKDMQKAGFLTRI